MAEKQRIGWIGMGRMGYPMAERLLKAGHDVSIWNRTKSKAEPLGKSGAKIVDKVAPGRGVNVMTDSAAWTGSATTIRSNPRRMARTA